MFPPGRRRSRRREPVGWPAFGRSSMASSATSPVASRISNHVSPRCRTRSTPTRRASPASLTGPGLRRSWRKRPDCSDRRRSSRSPGGRARRAAPAAVRGRPSHSDHRRPVGRRFRCATPCLCPCQERVSDRASRSRGLPQSRQLGRLGTGGGEPLEARFPDYFSFFSVFIRAKIAPGLILGYRAPNVGVCAMNEPHDPNGGRPRRNRLVDPGMVGPGQGYRAQRTADDGRRALADRS